MSPGFPIVIPAQAGIQFYFWMPDHPTGTGDAYRGGLLSDLVQGKDIVESAKMGSVSASYAVETYGTQEYSFTQAEFNERLNNC